MTPIPNVDWPKWRAKCASHNVGKYIEIGGRITDPWGSSGIVTEIDRGDPSKPLTAEDHGGFTVALDSHDGQPVDDREEHYALYNIETFVLID